MAGHDIIVIGASSGGVEALSNLVSLFPPDLPAAVFIVLHLSPYTKSTLDEIIDRKSALKAKTPQDGETIQHGHIYLAKPDFHLLVKPGYTSIIRGPRENRWRPSIDSLFRSAAVAYGPRVIGVILTGFLDDGTAGLQAVKRCGGIAIVQDPAEALFPDMPRNAAEAVTVDYALPIAQMGHMLNRLAREPASEMLPVPEDILLEMKILETKGESDIPSTEKWGDLTPVVCPDCGGPLWKLNVNGLERYRCHLGHAFSPHNLLAEQDADVERALWSAQRVLEERAKVLTNMANQERQRGHDLLAKRYEERAAESKAHAKSIQKLMQKKF